MPWQWDTEHYGGKENEDMMGWFYPEDIGNILGIKKLDAQSQHFKKQGL